MLKTISVHLNFFFKGHEESYNPPPEYLPTEEEVKTTEVPPWF